MRPRFKPSWGPELITRLREFNAAGRRVIDIAPELGKTPMAIYCKSHRLGLVWPKGHGYPAAPPKLTAPDVRPLVESALAADPAGRGTRPSWPLHLAAYIVNVELGYPMAAAARLIGRDPNLVKYAVGRIEDRRDEPQFDAFIERLGDQAREMVA